MQAEAGLTSGAEAGVLQLGAEFSSEELRSLDSEGRAVVTRHRTSAGHLAVINVYCPRADAENTERVRFKQQFYKALDIRANCLQEAGDMVVVCGDINTSHREVDHCDPYEEFGDNPGRRFLSHFLQNPSESDDTDGSADSGDREEEEVESDMIDEWRTTNVKINSGQFLDTFRIFHPNRMNAFTCWNTKMNCRSTNYGTRIDYIFASLNMAPLILDCDIQPEVLGSDHCPVLALFNLHILPPEKPPESCTKFFREFSGKQVKLSNFFTKSDKRPQFQIDKDNPLKNPAKKPRVEASKITTFFSKTSTSKEKMKEEKLVPLPFTKDPLMPEKSTELTNNNAKLAWGSILKGPPPAPLCPKHKEAAVKRKVTKKGTNTGREFWCCGRGEGRADDPEARCDFFKWVK